MEVVNGSRTFPRFPDLPAEIRSRVWHYAVPDGGPYLYFYRKDCWNLQSPSKDEPRLELEFRHDWLDDVDIEVPMLFVNWESRSIALPWLKTRCTKRHLRPGKQDPVYSRLMDPDLDALYVSPDAYEDFARDHRAEHDTGEKAYWSHPSIERFAMSQALLQKVVTTLNDALISHWQPCTAVYVVVDPPPELLHPLKDGQGHQWRYENTAGGAYRFDCDQRDFILNGPGYGCDDHIGDLLNDICSQTAFSAFWWDFDFEVRPVFAVKGS